MKNLDEILRVISESKETCMEAIHKCNALNNQMYAILVRTPDDEEISKKVSSTAKLSDSAHTLLSNMAEELQSLEDDLN